MKKVGDKRPASIGGAASSIGNIYQKKVAAWWLTRVLTQSTTVAGLFGLPNSVPVRVYGHTDDEVDDLRVEFTDDGKLYIQCKRSVQVSNRLDSQFGKAWLQFVNQLHRATVSKARVSCVLAFESGSGALDSLRALFQRARAMTDWRTLEACGATLKQRQVARKLTQLHRAAMKESPDAPDLRGTVLNTYIHELDLEADSNESVASADFLASVLVDHHQTTQALDVLRDLGEDLTTNRGLFFDLTHTRSRMRDKNVRLKDVPEFYPDLRELDAQSTRTLKSFKDNHRDQLNACYTLRRPVEKEALAKIAAGNLLVVGEPGVGKTGILMAIAGHFAGQGKRVWFLSVDEYQAESLALLGKELNLKHHFSDILGIAAEEGNVCLLVDGLDAAREHGRQKTWRSLVAEAIRARITVIATIRIFDLQNSPAWQQLFPLGPSDCSCNTGLSLDKVRLLNIEELSDPELDETLEQFPIVRQFCEQNSSVRRIARNIFNLQLLCDLSSTGLPANPVHTQLELLKAWWTARVGEESNSSLPPMLRTAVERMVSSRQLNCDESALETDALPEAKRIGLMRQTAAKPGYTPSGRVEFSHNVLFDYAAFRLFVAPKKESLVLELGPADSWGLFLRPSLNYYFCWLWDDYRPEFWARAMAFQSSTIPILHKTLVWLTLARNVDHVDDFAPVISGMINSDKSARAWLDLARGLNGCAEAEVWKPLFGAGSGMWWVEYALRLLSQTEPNFSLLGWQILYSLYYENKNPKPETLALINKAARLEVEAHWAIAVPFGPGSKPCIWLFCKTIDGGREESAALVRRMLAPEELAKSGYFRGREVAVEIETISKILPELAIEVYAALYGYKEQSSEQVPMGMRLRTSQHDLYSSAYHHLQEALPIIFAGNPTLATRAVCRVFTEGPLSQQEKDESGIWFEFNGRTVFAAGSIIHADHLGKTLDDRTRLLAAWCACLNQLIQVPDKSEKMRAVTEGLLTESNCPNVWAALFIVCADHPDLIGDSFWPVLRSPGVLSSLPFIKLTCKAVSALARSSSARDLNLWQQSVLELDRDHLRRRNYRNTGEVLKMMQAEYLASIPRELLTPESRAFFEHNSVVIEKDKGNLEAVLREQRRLIERDQSGLNPENPLHAAIEKDLIGLRLVDNAQTDAGILRQIEEIEGRFQTLDENPQTRLRGQFQNLISYQLRNLALNPKPLSPRDLSAALRLCEGLIQTASGRRGAIEAVAFFLGKRKRLTGAHKALLQKIVARPEHEVIEYFGSNMWPFLGNWPDFVFRCLENWTSRLDEKEVGNSLHHILPTGWFWWLLRKKRIRALKLLQNLFNSANLSGHTELSEGFLAWFMAVAIEDGDAGCARVAREALTSPEKFSAIYHGVTRVLTEWLFPRNTPNTNRSAVKSQRATEYAHVFFKSATAALKSYESRQISLPASRRAREHPAWIKPVYFGFHQFANELRFDSERMIKSFDSITAAEREAISKEWWRNCDPILDYLTQFLHPEVAQDLIAAFGSWLALQPTHSIRWLRVICEAGVKTNLFQDRIAVTDVINILRKCLSEHRDMLHLDREFFTNFSATLDAMFSTATPDALAMAAALDEFYR